MKKSTVQTDPRIQTVIDYIMLNPTEEYTSAKLGDIAEVAETTFRRLFKDATGKTATEFIRQVRLTMAARLLPCFQRSSKLYCPMMWDLRMPTILPGCLSRRLG